MHKIRHYSQQVALPGRSYLRIGQHGMQNNIGLFSTDNNLCSVKVSCWCLVLKLLAWASYLCRLMWGVVFNHVPMRLTWMYRARHAVRLRQGS
jgi:hypothetical protein